MVEQVALHIHLTHDVSKRLHLMEPSRSTDPPDRPPNATLLYGLPLLMQRNSLRRAEGCDSLCLTS